MTKIDEYLSFFNSLISNTNLSKLFSKYAQCVALKKNFPMSDSHAKFLDYFTDVWQ